MQKEHMEPKSPDYTGMFKERESRRSMRYVERIARVLKLDAEDLHLLQKLGIIRNRIKRELEKYEKAQILARELALLVSSRRHARRIRALYDQGKKRGDYEFMELGPRLAGTMYARLDPRGIGMPSSLRLLNHLFTDNLAAIPEEEFSAKVGNEIEALIHSLNSEEGGSAG